MKVILTEDVKNLGKKGDVLEASDGYARNYLIPKDLAQLATEEAQKENEKKIADQREEEQGKLKEIQKLASSIEGKEIIIKVKEKNGKLFGSVGAKEISKALTKEGQKVKTKEIRLKEPIKELGEYKVEVELDHGIETYLTIIVEKED